jgi:putative endonuclease
VYLLRCADGTIYCGCTNDLDRRLVRHGRGSVKYTRGRLPVELAYCEEAAGRGSALRREAAIKRLPRARKLGLCSGWSAPRPV